MRDAGAAKSDYSVKFELAPNVRDLAKLTIDEITADLEYLASKHPETFDKPSDVFRLIREIKTHPTHFYNNNRLDYALIVKRLNNNKIGKLAIDRQSSKTKHATKVKDSDLKRLKRVSDEKQEGNTGIIQTFIPSGSKSNNELGLPSDKSIISQSKAKSESSLDNLKIPSDLEKEIRAYFSKGENKEFKKIDWQELHKAAGQIYNLPKELLNTPYLLKTATLKQQGQNSKSLTDKDIIDTLFNAGKGNYEKSLIQENIDILRDNIEYRLKLEPIKEFGKNFAEYYHDGKGAVKKVLAEKQGQVSGAFYRDDLGDIDVVWGKVWTDKKGNIQGYGLAKIIEKHPEITPEILDDAIANGKISETHNGYNLAYKNYIVGINRGWNESGKKIAENKWVVTAFDDSLEKATSKAPVDSFNGKNAALANSNGIISQSDKKVDEIKLSGVGKLVEDDLKLNKFEKAVSEFSKEGKEFIDGIKRREKEKKDKINEISNKLKKINAKASKNKLNPHPLQKLGRFCSGA